MAEQTEHPQDAAHRILTKIRRRAITPEVRQILDDEIAAMEARKEAGRAR